MSLAIISVGGVIIYPGVDSGIFGMVGLAAVPLWGAAVLAAIGFRIAKKKQIASGIWAGVVIGLIGLVSWVFVVAYLFLNNTGPE